jgi:hypothetical protein
MVGVINWKNVELDKPFKTVTIEYFEEAVSDSTPRRIRVVTTTQDYGVGSSKSDPVTYTKYEYL